MQYYLRSNMKLYQVGDAGYLVRVDTGEESHMENSLLDKFPELFILKWSTKDL